MTIIFLLLLTRITIIRLVKFVQITSMFFLKKKNFFLAAFYEIKARKETKSTRLPISKYPINNEKLAVE